MQIDADGRRNVVHDGYNSGKRTQATANIAGPRGLARHGVRRRFLLVVVGLLALVVAGCSIVIEGGGSGRLVLRLKDIPSGFTSISYVATNQGFWRSVKSGNLHVTGSTETVDLGPVHVGAWHVEVTARRPGGNDVYVFEAVKRVRRDEVTTVAVHRWQRAFETRYAKFVAHDMNENPLRFYIDYFEGATVPEVAGVTGLWPSREKPIIHVYGELGTWSAESPCPHEAGCYDTTTKSIHVNAWQGSGFNTPVLTRTYVEWLIYAEGRTTPPFWFAVGLAHNEAERVRFGTVDWDNAWTRRQWEEVKYSNDPVPDLARHHRADKFTFTAVAHLLQTRNGRGGLRTLFELTRDGVPFDVAFAEAFDVGLPAYADFYAAAVKHVRR